MDKLYELIKSSVVVQATLAFVLAGTICYLLVTGQEAPKELWVAFAAILGYYFGSKAQQAIS